MLLCIFRRLTEVLVSNAERLGEKKPTCDHIVGGSRATLLLSDYGRVDRHPPAMGVRCSFVLVRQDLVKHSLDTLRHGECVAHISSSGSLMGRILNNPAGAWFNPRLAGANCIQPARGGPISSIAVARDYLHRRFALLSQNLTQQK
jgi:hypothetical protein